MLHTIALALFVAFFALSPVLAALFWVRVFNRD